MLVGRSVNSFCWFWKKIKTKEINRKIKRRICCTSLIVHSINVGLKKKKKIKINANKYNKSVLLRSLIYTTIIFCIYRKVLHIAANRTTIQSRTATVKNWWWTSQFVIRFASTQKKNRICFYLFFKWMKNKEKCWKNTKKAKEKVEIKKYIAQKKKRNQKNLQIALMKNSSLFPRCISASV